MEENTVVFDISSDKEQALEVAAGADDSSRSTKLLCDNVDCSDDVVVVGETKSMSLIVTAINNEDDDDCVVLDGDPDKPVAVDDHKADDGDDLIIVSWKGQIPCRDYPHPRNVCAEFNFSSTSHEMHCNLCHCYVCDIPAPCAHWGTGDTSIDHCHATDKKEFWKSLRKTFRLEKDAPLTVQVQVSDTTLALPLPQLNQTSARDIIRGPQNLVSRPTVIRGCSSSPQLTIPQMISQYRSRQSGTAFSRHGFPTRLARKSQMLRVHNNGVQNPGTFKRRGIIKSEVTHIVHGSSNNIKNASGSRCLQNASTRATSNDRIDIPWVPSMNYDSFTSQSTSQIGMGSDLRSTVPAQPQVYSQPLPHPEVYTQPLPEHQPYSQPVPEPQAYTQQNPLSNEGQNVNELGNQMQNSTCPDFSDFDDWITKTSQSNQPPEVENCQLPKTGCINEPAPVEDFNSQSNGSPKILRVGIQRVGLV